MRRLDEPLPGLVVLQTVPHRDERGAFARCYCRHSMNTLGLKKPVEQGNLSWNTHTHTLRGLHMQLGNSAETKIVQCLKGSIFDVGVDLREGSPTFGRWYGTTLSAENGRLMMVPEGFAHGFLTLEPHSLVNYLVTASYDPKAEIGYRYDDPALAIDWPFSPAVISARDLGHALLPRLEVA